MVWAVGTNALIERLSGYEPDDYIAGVFSHHFTGGWQHGLSATQLWRVHFLAALSEERDG